MAGIIPIQNGQAIILPPNHVQPANTSWLKTAATVGTVAISVISAIASFFFLPIETAFISTGFIAAAALALYACFKRCFPDSPATVPFVNQFAPIIPPRVVQTPVIYSPPLIAQPGGRGPTPIVQTIHPGHMQPGGRGVPTQPGGRGPTPVVQTVHPGQVHIQPGGRGVPTQPGGRGPTVQTVHPGPVPLPLTRSEAIPPSNPFVAFARSVVDDPHVGRGPIPQPPATPPLESGRGGTIKPGIGLRQDPSVGRGSVSGGRTAPAFQPRPDPALGSTIRIGAGRNQMAIGPTVGVGGRGRG
jgi:hypothetical protein